LSLLDQLARKAEIINAELQRLIRSWGFPDPIDKAIQYIVESGGKRIRPILALLSCEAVGGEDEVAMQAAIAVELIHNASLLWDDVIDRDDLRRGKITVHKKWDKNIAILAGAMLTSKAIELISDQPELLDMFLKGIGKMIEGQVLDITGNLESSAKLFDSKSEKEIFEILRSRFRQKAFDGMEWDESGESQLITEFTEFEEERDYFEMISLKTSSLLKLATRIGAILGGGTAKEIDALAKYGFYLGLAFQIRDDLIGITSDELTLGKPVGSDIRQGKLNLFTIFALRNLDNDALSDLLKIMKDNLTNSTIVKVRKILDRCGALNYASDKLELIAQTARNSLTDLEDSDPKKILQQFITFIIERKF